MKTTCLTKVRTLSGIALISLMLAVNTVFAVFGALDGSFGTNGSTPNAWDLNDSNLIGMPDGRFLISGWYGGSPYPFYLRRYLPNGAPDTSFGISSWAIPFEYNGHLNDIALQKDGKVLVTGSIGGNYYVWRFNTNGVYDSGFGVNGRAFIGYSPFPDGERYNRISAFRTVATMAPESIVVTIPTATGTMMLRLNSSGTVSSSFGINGSVAVNSDLLFLTRDATITQSAAIFACYFLNDNLAIKKYSAAGQIDTTYGTTTANYGNPFGQPGTNHLADFKYNISGQFLIGGNYYNECLDGCRYWPFVGLHSPNGGLQSLNSQPSLTNKWGHELGVNEDNTVIFAGQDFVRKYSSNLLSIQNEANLLGMSLYVQRDGKFILASHSSINRYFQ